MIEEEDEVPPLDPKKVALFVLLLGLIAFAGWRYWRARVAVAAVAEASKDYRRLFPARSAEAPAPPPKPIVVAGAPISGIGLLKIDDDMREPKPVPAAAPPAAPPETPPVAVVKTESAAPIVKPVKKEFKRPRLNSGAFSGLNGGSGVGFSGRTVSGGGGAPPPADPPVPTAEDKK